MIDFLSRNPVPCNSSLCCICTKIADSSRTTVWGTVFPMTSSTSMMSTAGWRDLKATDSDLRRAHAILTSNSKLPTKARNPRDLKAYLRLCSISRSGLIIALKTIPLKTKPAKLIVIPKAYAFNFAKVLNIRLDHPSLAELKRQFYGLYFMLNCNNIFRIVQESCKYPCQASKILPKEMMTYNTETKPVRIGSHYNCDVMEESLQKN